MSRTAKKVTVNLPTDVLEKAQKITGQGITPTIIEGLRELERREQLSALRQLRGKVRFEAEGVGKALGLNQVAVANASR
jgi:hypothetical protein